jgi:hypothetical protein
MHSSTRAWLVRKLQLAPATRPPSILEIIC